MGQQVVLGAVGEWLCAGMRNVSPKKERDSAVNVTRALDAAANCRSRGGGDCCGLG